jgi:hypothetical protein
MGQAIRTQRQTDQRLLCVHVALRYASDNPLNNDDPSGLCNANPFSEGFWTEGNCISKSPLNPIPYYEKEIEAYEDGCGYFASVTNGLEGAVVGAAAFAGEEGEAEVGAEGISIGAKIADRWRHAGGPSSRSKRRLTLASKCRP